MSPLFCFLCRQTTKKELNYEEQEKGKCKIEQDWKDFQFQAAQVWWCKTAWQIPDFCLTIDWQLLIPNVMSAAFGRKISDLFDLSPHCLNTLTKDLRIKELAHSFYPLKLLQAILLGQWLHLEKCSRNVLWVMGKRYIFLAK